MKTCHNCQELRSWKIYFGTGKVLGGGLAKVWPAHTESWLLIKSYFATAAAAPNIYMK